MISERILCGCQGNQLCGCLWFEQGCFIGGYEAGQCFRVGLWNPVEHGLLTSDGIGHVAGVDSVDGILSVLKILLVYFIYGAQKHQWGGEVKAPRLVDSVVCRA